MLSAELLWFVVVLWTTEVGALPLATQLGTTYAEFNAMSIVNVSSLNNVTTMKVWSADICAFQCTNQQCKAAQYNVSGWCTLANSCSLMTLTSGGVNKIYLICKSTLKCLFM
jgi:hypothetical protein